MRVKNVIGPDVVDENGGTVRKIGAVAVGRKSASKYSVVTVQCYLDIGRKAVALPVRNFAVQDEPIVLPDTGAKPKQALGYVWRGVSRVQ